MYKDIPYSTTSGERVTGHHYINESRPDEQFMSEVHWDEMTVHVRILYDGDWVTVGIVPLTLNPDHANPPEDSRPYTLYGLGLGGQDITY